MITVVMPTLNSGEMLERSLPTLLSATLQGMISRVIITDGGSTDQTEAIASATGAEFVSGEAGRGVQLAAGAEAARAFQKAHDWLLFLHADTVLQEGWEKEVASFMMAAPHDMAAYFSFRFDENVWQARIVEAGVWCRCRVLSLPYGDQGLLISRAFYDTLGGHGAMPLFEDVDIVRRIRKAGRLRQLRAVATTSAARYKQNGYFPRVWKNLNCLMSYYRGVPPEKILENYQ